MRSWTSSARPLVNSVAKSAFQVEWGSLTAHNLYAHLDGAGALEDRRKHEGGVLGEGVRRPAQAHLCAWIGHYNM
jgi:hypothetical protein